MKHLINYALIGISLLGANTSEAKQKPNIVYILADDLGIGDLSCYGQKIFSTPNIDQLAKDGMLFTQHYSGCPVCAPSRCSLMTGLTIGHAPIRGNKEWKDEGQWPMPEATLTVAEMLKNEGYTTGAFGKWGLGYPGSEGDPNKQGFDEFFGFNCQRLAHNYFPAFLRHNQEIVPLKKNIDDQLVEYAPEIIHEQVLKFIQDNQKKPFFLFYANILPHAEMLIPEKYMSEFRGKFLPEKSFDGIKFGDKTYRNGGYGTQSEGHAAFVAMVTLLDQQVGEVINKLKELGIEKNTLVIFSSDNGPHQEAGADPDYFNSNGPYRGIKRDLYEGGMHEPMLAKWPGKIKPGTQTNHISAFWDVMPTLAEIAKAHYPGTFDGLSFLPTLLGKKGQKHHEYLYWEFHELEGRQAIRKGNWKLVRYKVLIPSMTTTELYDLDNDPAENNNLADQHPEIVKELISQMEKSRTPSDVFTFQSPTIIK